jgi:hypothetical protein
MTILLKFVILRVFFLNYYFTELSDNASTFLNYYFTELCDNASIFLNYYFTELSDTAIIFSSFPNGICIKTWGLSFCRYIVLILSSCIVNSYCCYNRQAAVNNMQVPVGIADSTFVHNNYSTGDRVHV